MERNHKQELLDKYHQKRKQTIESMGEKCALCESTYLIEIDHIDWRTKEYDLGKIWYNEELYQKELKKCQLLCRDCHKQKTKQDLSEKFTKDRSQLHGTISQYYRYKCRCDKCRQAYSEYRKEQRLKKGETTTSYKSKW